jgi:hypothetical protein
MPEYFPFFSKSIGGIAGDMATLMSLDGSSLEHPPRRSRLSNKAVRMRSSLIVFS